LASSPLFPELIYQKSIPLVLAPTSLDFSNTPQARFTFFEFSASGKLADFLNTVGVMDN